MIELLAVVCAGNIYAHMCKLSCRLGGEATQRHGSELWRQQVWAQILTPFTTFVTLVKPIDLSKASDSSSLKWG